MCTLLGQHASGLLAARGDNVAYPIVDNRPDTRIVALTSRSHKSPPHTSSTPAAVTRAAEYVRMSTEHQKYSTENQADAIRDYARRHGMEIVRTYADAGKSGLSIDGRDALKRLIEDVQDGQSDFTTILVYDVSRWGRFQDADERAPTTNIFVSGLALQSIIVPSNSRMTAAPFRRSSRASSGRWPANTAENSRPRSLPGNAG